MAQKGRKVAGFALVKSIAYSYFLDKLSTNSRKTATTGRSNQIRVSLRKLNLVQLMSLRFCRNTLFYKVIVGEKAGVGNKPGSVENNHSSGIAVTSHLEQPTRESVRDRRWATPKHPYWGCCALPYSPIWSCSGRGLPCRELLPVARCALTAPFHPYQPKLAVYFLWHFPWAHASQALPGALSEGARTFLYSELQRLSGQLRLSRPRFYRVTVTVTTTPELKSL